MMSNYVELRELELEEKRQVAFARKKELLNEVESAQIEIDHLDIRLHELELFKVSMPSCVPAPINNSIEAQIDECNDILKEESTKIQITEVPKPVNGIPIAIESKHTIGEKTNRILHLMKKNEIGMPSNDKLTIRLDDLIDIKNIIKERKAVHYDDFEGINRKKFAILFLYLDDQVSGEFANIKYGNIEGRNGKYLYWVN